MKTLFAIPLVVLLLFSCSEKDELDIMQNKEEEHSVDFSTQKQKWELVKMTGQVPNSETTGAGMAWQEHYLFQPDGSFTKVRKIGDVAASASGTYSFHNSFDKKYLELTYLTKNELIGSCTADQKETLILREDRLRSTWLACDGPGLEYRKVN